MSTTQLVEPVDHTTPDAAAKPGRDHYIETRNLKVLHDAIMLSSANHHAVIAMAAIAMAEAQGCIKAGPHARRQTLLAMIQGLRSAGYGLTIHSLATTFNNMRRVGMISVDRRSSPETGAASPKGGIDGVRLARPKKIVKPKTVTSSEFTVEWNQNDVEIHPMMAVSSTPKAMQQKAAPAAVEASDAQAKAGQDISKPHMDELAAEAVEYPSPVERTHPHVRSFWAFEGDHAESY